MLRDMSTTSIRLRPGCSGTSGGPAVCGRASATTSSAQAHHSHTPRCARRSGAPPGPSAAHPASAG